MPCGVNLTYGYCGGGVNTAPGTDSPGVIETVAVADPVVAAKSVDAPATEGDAKEPVAAVKSITARAVEAVAPVAEAEKDVNAPATEQDTKDVRYETPRTRMT